MNVDLSDVPADGRVVEVLPLVEVRVHFDIGRVGAALLTNGQSVPVESQLHCYCIFRTVHTPVFSALQLQDNGSKWSSFCLQAKGTC